MNHNNNSQSLRTTDSALNFNETKSNFSRLKCYEKSNSRSLVTHHTAADRRGPLRRIPFDAVGRNRNDRTDGPLSRGRSNWS